MIDIETRIVTLADDIDCINVEEIINGILTINAKDRKKIKKYKKYEPKPIILHIGSFGGSVYDAWSLIDIMRASETPIYTYCTGYAMSAACHIFLAGHKRYMTEHATLMWHQMSEELYG